MRRCHLGLLSYLCPLFVSISLQAQTIYSNDSIQSVPVIEQLNVDDLDKGKLYKFYFRGVETATHQYHYVPVMVVKGKAEGKKVLLQAGIHGDELNGIKTLQTVVNQLDPAHLNGTVVVVIGPNRSGIEAINRHWALTSDSGYYVDFNRVFPGKEFGNSAERQAWLLMNKLYKNNAEVVIDFHTQSTGSKFPFFIYADYRHSEIQTLAELFPADQIKADPGEKGSVETTFVEQNIPAITVELGAPREYNQDMIQRGVEGVKNVLIHYKMLNDKMTQTAKDMSVFIGQKATSVRSQTGGFAEILVDVNENVKAGQLVAIQRDAFGQLVQEYTAPEAGKVLAVATDVVREPRALLVRILSQSDDPKCDKGC